MALKTSLRQEASSDPFIPDPRQQAELQKLIDALRKEIHIRTNTEKEDRQNESDMPVVARVHVR